MDDDRVKGIEESLWTGDASHYRDLIDPDCLMVVPQDPFLLCGDEAVAAVSDTPRWTSIKMERLQIARPQDGLIVVAYHARADREQGDGYDAYCTTTYRRLGHDEWRVIQHQQTPPPIIPAG